MFNDTICTIIFSILAVIGAFGFLLLVYLATAPESVKADFNLWVRRFKYGNQQNNEQLQS